MTVTAGNADGGFPNDAGGGLVARGSAMILAGCRFERNRAVGAGGGIHAVNGANLQLIGCVLAGNQAAAGGGLYSADSAPLLSNCTIYGNTAGMGGGLFAAGGGVSIANSIVWANRDSSGAASPAGLRAIKTPLDVHYSCVQDASAGDGNAFPGVGNIDADPLISMEATGLNAWLPGAGSPCIEAGSNRLVAADLGDRDGNGNQWERSSGDLYMGPRIADDPAAPETGDPGGLAGGIVDMGAVERWPDCNSNGLPYGCVLACGPGGGGCDVAGCGAQSDCNKDGIPDLCQGDSDGDGTGDVCERTFGDFDLDGDVDQADFAVLQLCLDRSRLEPACNAADLNFDASIGAGDVGLFIRCLSGPLRPYDPSCRP